MSSPTAYVLFGTPKTPDPRRVTGHTHHDRALVVERLPVAVGETDQLEQPRGVAIVGPSPEVDQIAGSPHRNDGGSKPGDEQRFDRRAREALLDRVELGGGRLAGRQHRRVDRREVVRHVADHGDGAVAPTKPSRTTSASSGRKASAVVLVQHTRRRRPPRPRPNPPTADRRSRRPRRPSASSPGPCCGARAGATTAGAQPVARHARPPAAWRTPCRTPPPPTPPRSQGRTDRCCRPSSTRCSHAAPATASSPRPPSDRPTPVGTSQRGGWASGRRPARAAITGTLASERAGTAAATVPRHERRDGDRHEIAGGPPVADGVALEEPLLDDRRRERGERRGPRPIPDRRAHRRRPGPLECHRHPDRLRRRTVRRELPPRTPAGGGRWWRTLRRRSMPTATSGEHATDPTPRRARSRSPRVRGTGRRRA
jgi:hypothetical protein